MYGYLKPKNSVLEYGARRYYRERYCTLCHALWNYYGMLPRFVLSYDVTFAAILLDLDSQVDFEKDKMVCYKRNSIKTNELEWKGLAAISVMLAAGKLRDNVLDENSFVSKSILKLFSKAIQNAEKDFPDLSAFLTNSLEHMNSLEESNGSLTQLSNAFAEMMCGAYKMLFGESNYILAIARHVSKWVYFIDAIDDLDDDIRHGHYNPIANFANSSEDLLTNHTDVLVQFISSQREELLPFYSDLQNNSVSNIIIRSILNETIPSTTKEVLLKEYGKSTSAHVRYIQAKEGIIFA